MARTAAASIQMLDYQPAMGDFLSDALSGLVKIQKELPAKYFYDERGSKLFEKICSLDEYYIPRTEISIMHQHIGEMVELLGSNVQLVEYGCGNCHKTQLLLDNMHEPAAYVPIDISREQLWKVAQQLMADHPGFEILPVCADYTTDFKLPSPMNTNSRAVAYFPGSSIGNFHPQEAVRFMRRIAEVCGPGGSLLIGVDLKKDSAVLHRAYNDGRQVTSAFNINMLERMNRELGTKFETQQFEHYAFYNPAQGRIEMHLVSLRDQSVQLNGTSISFAMGESIWTESSYKYHPAEFARLAEAAGFKVERIWTDPQQWFSVQYMVLE